MTNYLLDTNHLSPGKKHTTKLLHRLQLAVRLGNRVGTIVQTFFELEAGLADTVAAGSAYTAIRQRSRFIRIWTLEASMAKTYGQVFLELRQKGRVVSQVDKMLATLARYRKLILLTTDRDFEALPDLRVENWLA